MQNVFSEDLCQYCTKIEEMKSDYLTKQCFVVSNCFIMSERQNAYQSTKLSLENGKISGFPISLAHFLTRTAYLMAKNLDPAYASSKTQKTHCTDPWQNDWRKKGARRRRKAQIVLAYLVPDRKGAVIGKPSVMSEASRERNVCSNIWTYLKNERTIERPFKYLFTSSRNQEEKVWNVFTARYCWLVQETWERAVSWNICKWNVKERNCGNRNVSYSTGVFGIGKTREPEDAGDWSLLLWCR